MYTPEATVFFFFFFGGGGEGGELTVTHKKDWTFFKVGFYRQVSIAD